MAAPACCRVKMKMMKKKEAASNLCLNTGNDDGHLSLFSNMNGALGKEAAASGNHWLGDTSLDIPSVQLHTRPHGTPDIQGPLKAPHVMVCLQFVVF